MKKILISLQFTILLLLCGRSNIFAYQTATDKTVTIYYDDTYSISKAGFNDYYVADAKNDIKTINISSYEVMDGKKTDTPDTDAVRLYQDGTGQTVKATGIGTAQLTLTNTEDETDKVTLTVQVKPAVLTYMMVAGQSNAAGFCSDNKVRPVDSVVCDEDQIYSTTASVEPVGTSGLHGTRDLTGVLFSESCTPDNAYKFVPENLTDEKSLSGDKLQYTTDHMSANGTGRTGPDSGLAYEWNKLTGDKVWVINTAVGATGIDTWNPGGRCFENAAKLGELTTDTYEAEIAAGHYTAGKKLLFWLQGENDKKMLSDDYTPRFLNMYKGMKERVGFDALGIIMVRSSDTNQHKSPLDLTMTGPRITQYYVGQGMDNSDIYVASNVNEQWVTDSGVKNYFSSAYPGGRLDYPLRKSVSSALPTTMSQIHNDIHYSQIGHNENGITAAYGMYKALYQRQTADAVSWVDAQGATINTQKNVSYPEISLDKDASLFIMPKATPSYTKGAVSIIGDSISYDASTGTMTWKKGGRSYLVYKSAGREVSRIAVDAYGDFSDIVGKSFTGIYNDSGTYMYLKDGKLQGDVTTLVRYNDEWWYVRNGIVDFSYNSLVKYNNAWWYVHDGKVDFKSTTLVKYNDSWWYVAGGYVRFNETTLCKFNGLWWYVRGGCVRFNETTLCKYNGNWFYVRDGYVHFNETTLCKYNGNWFYVKGGYVRFNETTLCKYNGYWFYVKSGYVRFDETTLCKYNGTWWYVKGGYVRFDTETLCRYNNIWWHVKGGYVRFDTETLCKYNNIWWYVKGGYVRFDTETLCKYNSNWFYVTDGYVHFGVDKQVGYNGNKFNVKNGIVVF